MKICTSCSEIKPLSDFYIDKNSEYCIECIKKRLDEKGKELEEIKMNYNNEEPKMKECRLCKVEKPLSDFYNDNKNKIDGKQCYCKACSKKKLQERNARIKSERKKCNKCGKTKPFSEFWKNSNIKDGHSGTCRKCSTITNQRRGIDKIKVKKGIKVKLCSRCMEEKPLSEFHRDRHNRDGYRGQCKDCKNEENKKYRQRKKAQKEEMDSDIKQCSKCGNTKPLSEFWKYATSKDGYNNQCKTCLTEGRSENRVKKENKKCKSCGAVKPISEFWKDRGAKDGHFASCRECLEREMKKRVAKKMSERNAIGVKLCTKCRKLKPLGEFWRCLNRSDGYNSTCKECKNENNKLQQKLNNQANSDIKQCSRCKEEKIITEFAKNRYYKDVYSNTCQKCYDEIYKPKKVNKIEQLTLVEEIIETNNIDVKEEILEVRAVEKQESVQAVEKVEEPIEVETVEEVEAVEEDTIRFEIEEVKLVEEEKKGIKSMLKKLLKFL